MKKSAVLLLEGRADGVCAGGRIAGTDVDLFSGAGAGAVVIYAVGDVTGNTVVLVAGLAGLFRGIVVHSFQNPFNPKNYERYFLFRLLLCLCFARVIHARRRSL